MSAALFDRRNAPEMRCILQPAFTCLATIVEVVLWIIMVGFFASKEFDVSDTGPTPGIFYSIDLRNGRETWHRSWANDIPILVVTSTTRLYYITADKALCYLHGALRETGEILWQTAIGRPPSWMMTDASTLYCFDTTGKTMAIDGQSGDVKWAVMVNHRIVNRPQQTKDDLVIYSADRKVILLDKDTGAEKTVYSLKDHEGYPFAFTRNMWFVRRLDSIAAVRPDNYSRIWEFHACFPSDSGHWLTRPTVRDGLVVVGSTQGELIVLDAQTGNQRTRINVGPAVYVPPVVTGGVAYVILKDGTIVMVDMQTTKEIWRRTFPDASSTDLMIHGDKLCFVGERRVYAVNRKTGQDIWQFSTIYPIFDTHLPFDGKKLFITCEKQ